MKLNPARTLAVLGAVALAAFAGAAQARDNVYWSVGIAAAPGVAIGVGNVRPVVVAPAPVYVAPAPVYVAPAPVYIAPAPVYYAQPAPVYYGSYYAHPGKRKGHKHHRHWD